MQKSKVYGVQRSKSFGYTNKENITRKLKKREDKMNTETPKRIQRKRTKGWRMPPNTVSVTRPGRWGNPFVVGFVVPDEWTSVLDNADRFHFMKFECGYVDSPENAVMLFEKYVTPTLDVSELKGKNLACFCPLDKPCHADVLLRLCNE